MKIVYILVSVAIWVALPSRGAPALAAFLDIHTWNTVVSEPSKLTIEILRFEGGVVGKSLIEYTGGLSDSSPMDLTVLIGPQGDEYKIMIAADLSVSIQTPVSIFKGPVFVPAFA